MFVDKNSHETDISEARPAGLGGEREQKVLLELSFI